MSVRDWLNNNSTVVTAAAICVLVVALGVMLLTQRGPGPGALRDAYFWDLETQEPFVASITEVPPIEAPSGGRGVRAYLYTCGECTPEEWFGHLETYTEEAKEYYERDGVPPEDDHELLVRPLEGGSWVPYDAAADVIERPYEPCPGGGERFPRQCRPGDEAR